MVMRVFIILRRLNVLYELENASGILKQFDLVINGHNYVWKNHEDCTLVLNYFTKCFE